MPHPKPDYIAVLHKGVEADMTVAIVCEGKDIRYTINRRQAFKIASDIFDALKALEPGK